MVVRHPKQQGPRKARAGCAGYCTSDNAAELVPFATGFRRSSCNPRCHDRPSVCRPPICAELGRHRHTTHMRTKNASDTHPRARAQKCDKLQGTSLRYPFTQDPAASPISSRYFPFSNARFSSATLLPSPRHQLICVPAEASQLPKAEKSKQSAQAQR